MSASHFFSRTTLARLSQVLLLTLLLAGFSGCDQLKPKSYYQYNMSANTSSGQAPLSFKAHYLDYLRDPHSISMYVCNTVDSFVQDRTLQAKAFTYKDMQQALSELPDSLQQSYATCYLEQDIRREGFRAYLEDGEGFLALEALKGYRQFQAIPQAKILTQALMVWQENRKGKLETRRASQIYKEFDKLWGRQDRNPVMIARGIYMQRMLQAGKWPISEQK